MSKKSRKPQAAIKQQTWLEKMVVWGTMALFFLTPLAYFPWRIASYVTSKEYFFMGGVDVVIIFWIWLMIIDQRYRISKKVLWPLMVIILFVGWLTITSFTGADHTVSFASLSLESGTGMFLLYHAFFLMMVVISLVGKEGIKFLKKIATVIFGSGCLVAIMIYLGPKPFGFGLMNPKFLIDSLGGATLGNILPAAAFLIVAIFCGVLLTGLSDTKKRRWTYGILTGLIILCPAFLNIGIWNGSLSIHQILSSPLAILGQARMATVSLWFGLIVFLLGYLNTRGDIKRRYIGYAGTFLLAIVVIIGIIKVTNPASSLHSRFITESGNRPTDWAAAVSGIHDRPVLGWGKENYRIVFQKYFDPHILDASRGTEGWNLHAHNVFLEVGVEGGIPAMVLYVGTLGAFFVSLYVLYRKKIVSPGVGMVLMGLGVAYILQDQMAYDAVTALVMWYGMLGIVIGLLGYKHITQELPADQEVNVGDFIIGSLITIGVVVVWIVVVVIPVQKTRVLYRMSHEASNVRAGEYDQLLQPFGAYALRGDFDLYTESLFYAYDAQKDQIKSNKEFDQVAVGEIDSILKNGTISFNEHPNDYHLVLNLLQLEGLRIFLTGMVYPNQENQIETLAHQGMQLAPNDPRIYLVYAQALTYENKIEQARLLINQAFNLNPEYPASKVAKQGFEKMQGN